MVGYPFQVAADEDQLRSLADCPRVFHHVGQQLTKHLLYQVVDLAVGNSDPLSEGDVELHVRLE